MNICFFALNMQEETTEGAAVGGIERASSLLAKELRHRGHRVEFYSIALRPLPHLLFTSLFPLLSRRARSERARFHQFLREKKINIVVCHGGGWRILFLLKNLPCGLITMWHATPFFSYDAEYLIKRLKIRSRFLQRIFLSEPVSSLIRKFYSAYHNRFFLYALCHSDKFVLLSDRFIPEFPLAKKFPHKVCAIPNIATPSTELIDFSAKRKELLWVGRVEFPHKRPDFMLRIWQRLQGRFPDWSLRFVGDGKYLPELKALSKELGMQRVSFEGFQAPAPYYRSASIFCMTSAYEGFGLVLVEAQAYGCVPVAFNSFSAVRDIIDDGVNGVLVPPFDLDAYAEKLAQLMSNTELRERLALNAQKGVAKFSAEAIGDKWEKLLREVVGENP